MQTTWFVHAHALHCSQIFCMHRAQWYGTVTCVILVRKHCDSANIITEDPTCLRYTKAETRNPYKNSNGGLALICFLFLWREADLVTTKYLWQGDPVANTVFAFVNATKNYYMVLVMTCFIFLN